MKFSRKIFLLVFVFSLTIFTISSVDASFEKIEKTEKNCLVNFSVDEQKNMLFFNNFLITKWWILKEKVSWIESYMDKLQASIDNTLNCEMFDAFDNYSEFKLEVMIFIKKIIALNSSVSYKYRPDIGAEVAIIKLQRHLVDLISVDNNVDDEIETTSETSLNMNVNIPSEIMWEEKYANIDINLDFDVKWEMSAKQKEMKINVKLDGDAKLDIKDTKYDYVNDKMVEKNFWGELWFWIDFDFLQKNNLYMKLNDLTFNLDGLNMPEETKFEMAVAKQIIKDALVKIKDKYILMDINKEEQQMIINMLQSSNKIFWKLKNEAIMSFYKQWDVWYGKINNNFCEIISQGYAKENCIDAIENADKEAKGRWYIIMKRIENQYVLWITDKFTETKLPKTKSNLTKIITWNKEKISSVNLDFWKNNDIEWHILYEKNKLDVLVKYGSFENDFSISVVWDINKNQKHFVIEAQAYNDIATFNWDIYVTNRDKNVHEMTMTFTVESMWQIVAKWNLHNKEIIKYLQRLEIIEPNKTNTISTEEVEALFDF